MVINTGKDYTCKTTADKKVTKVSKSEIDKLQAHSEVFILMAQKSISVGEHLIVSLNQTLVMN